LPSPSTPESPLPHAHTSPPSVTIAVKSCPQAAMLAQDALPRDASAVIFCKATAAV